MITIRTLCLQVARSWWFPPWHVRSAPRLRPATSPSQRSSSHTVQANAPLTMRMLSVTSFETLTPTGQVPRTTLNLSTQKYLPFTCVTSTSISTHMPVRASKERVSFALSNGRLSMYRLPERLSSSIYILQCHSISQSGSSDHIRGYCAVHLPAASEHMRSGVCEPSFVAPQQLPARPHC